MESPSDKSDPIQSSTVDSPAAKCQATKPEAATNDLIEEQVLAMENLHLRPPAIDSGKEYIEKLRSLEIAWGEFHQGIQERSNMLNELRAEFSDFKKEVQAVERLLRSRKR
ncbi:hypothetical protein HDV63DRAFT_310730 [Trichoderma sp. SZMC 28014]